MDAAARLLIHAPDVRCWGMGAALQCLWARVGRDAPPPELQIHDLRGRRQLVLSEIGSLVDIALPPGTYHVTVDRVGRRRRYTVTLVRGGASDLHLESAAPMAPRSNRL